MSVTAYVAPASIAEAVGELEAALPAAALFAGGTDVLPQIRAGRTFGTIVDLKRIDEVMQIEQSADSWLIGAGVPGYRIGGHEALRAAYPGLVESVELIGSTQIQGRATIGGNVCNASPAADTVPALLANDATCLIVGPAGRREIPLSELITGPGTTTLAPAEIVTAFRLPVADGNIGDAALRFTPRTEMDIAVANTAVRIVLDGDRCIEAAVAIGAVGPRALRVPEAEQALVGADGPTDAVLERVAQACRAAADPVTDKRGTVAFRVHVIGVLATRAATIAWTRARSEPVAAASDGVHQPVTPSTDEDQTR